MIKLAKFALIVCCSAISFAAQAMAFPSPLERTEYLKFTGVNSFAIANGSLSNHSHIRYLESNKLYINFSSNFDKEADELFEQDLLPMNIDNYLLPYNKVNWSGTIDAQFSIQGHVYNVQSLHLAFYEKGWHKRWAIGGPNCMLLGRNTKIDAFGGRTELACEAYDEQDQKVFLFFETSADRLSLPYNTIHVHEGEYGSF